MATTTQETGRRVALDRIRVPENVRALDDGARRGARRLDRAAGHARPASSCASDGDGFELVAGFHRIAAARSLGLADVPVVVRDAETEDADRAVENITRKQLNPYEEAKAVQAMLDRGLTEDGAAQALGWPKTRVTARVKILELPERAQQLIGEGVIPLSAVDQLRAIGTVAPDAARRRDRLPRRRQRVGRRAARPASPAGCSTPRSPTPATARCSPPTCTRPSAHEIAELRLGKKTEQLYAQAEKLHRSSTATPTVRRRSASPTQDVDQARAAGVLIEFERGRPIIVDRPLYRELVKDGDQAHPRRARGQGRRGRQEKKTARAGKAAGRPA